MDCRMFKISYFVDTLNANNVYGLIHNQAKIREYS